MLMILLAAGGAALGALAELLPRRPVSAAGREGAMAAGAFAVSRMLTTDGYLWLPGHARFTYEPPVSGHRALRPGGQPRSGLPRAAIMRR